MLKGHVFSNQIFENQIFALFINTFLDGADGISGNYKNSMDLSYEGSVITIDTGAICIQGRFLEESSTTEVDVGTDTGYGSLVIEIDLDENNTTTVLNQAYYKVLTDTSDYPELEQTEIVKNNSGIYQYELARFKITSSGISSFTDKRTYLDFDSIYTYIKENYETLMTEQEEAFTEWFENIQATLSDDVVGNLQTEIEELEDKLDDYLPLTGGDISGNITVSGTSTLSGAITAGSSLTASGILKSKKGLQLTASVPYINFYHNSASSVTSQIYTENSTTLGVSGNLIVEKAIHGQAIEIDASEPYIDFHYDNDTSVDYTSRLIETSSGVLEFIRNEFKNKWRITGFKL